MIQIWHEKLPNFGLGPKGKFPKDFELVAEINTDSLEEAFKLTNSIDSNWCENTEVNAIKNPCRSTSVGDVAVKNGKVYYCDMIGWQEYE